MPGLPPLEPYTPPPAGSLADFLAKLKARGGPPADTYASGGHNPGGTPPVSTTGAAIPLANPALFRVAPAQPQAQPLLPSQGPLGALPAGSALGPAPTPPTAPDLSPLFSARGQLARHQVDSQTNTFQVQGAQNDAELARLRAQQLAMPAHDPNDPAFKWNAVQPQSLGAPERVDLPVRGAPSHDPASQGLAMLASVFDPRGAGAYSAAPLQASLAVNQQQYEDRLRAYRQAVEQNAAQYEAQKANAEQANRFALINAEQQHVGDVASLADKQAVARANAPLAGGIAGGEALSGPLSDFSQSARTAAGLGADVEDIDREIGAAQLAYKMGIDQYDKTYGPYARYLTGLADITGRQNVADTKAGASLGVADIRGKYQQATGAGHDQAHLQGIDKHEAGATTRTGMNNATSTANNVRSNADNGSDSPSGDMLKDADVKLSWKGYQLAAEHANILTREVAKLGRPTQEAKDALRDSQANVTQALADFTAAKQRWQAKQAPAPSGAGGASIAPALNNSTNLFGNINTPTPGGAASSASPASRSTAPGAPPKPAAPAPAGPRPLTYDPKTNSFR